MVDPVVAFQLYMGVRLHFVDKNYDFFRNRGAVSGCDLTALDKKSYSGAIYSLAKKMDLSGLCDYYVANMLVEQGRYIFDHDSNGLKNYHQFSKRKQARKFTFESELTRFVDKESKHGVQFLGEHLAVVKGKQYPTLLRAFIGGSISPETMVILNRLRPFLDGWDATVKDQLIYPQASFQLRRLDGFIRILDLTPYETLLCEIFTEPLKVV